MYGSATAKDAEPLDQPQLFDIIVESSLTNGSILELRSFMHCLSAKRKEPKFTTMLDDSLRRNPRAASQMPMAYNKPDAALLQEYLYEEGILPEINEKVTYDMLLETLELESLIGMVMKLASHEGVVESFFDDPEFTKLYNEARSALDTLLNHAMDNVGELYDYYKGAHEVHQRNTQSCCESLCKLFAKIGDMAKVLVVSSPVLATAFVLWDIGLVAQLMFLFNIVFEVGWVTFALTNGDLSGLFSIGMFLWYEIHKFHTEGIDAVWVHDNAKGFIPGIPHAILPLVPNQGSMTTPEPILITLLAFPVFIACSACILACCGASIGGSVLASSALLQVFEELKVRLRGTQGGYTSLHDENSLRQQVQRNRARISMITVEQNATILSRQQRDREERRQRVQKLIESRRRDDSSGSVVVDITDDTQQEQPASSTGGAQREERAELRDTDAIPDVRPSDVRITLDTQVTVDTQHADIERQLSQLQVRHATLQTLYQMQSDAVERTRTQLRLKLLAKRIGELRATLAAVSA